MHQVLRLFLPFAAGYYLSFLLRNVNAVIAPDLTRELGLSAADLGLLTSAYFLTFASFQLPLGILLDRYGPRRVQTALLLIASAGSIAFAFGGGLAELAAARALIGLGVSACLMSSFKVLAVWYPPERLPSLNAAIMVAGGLGALTATTPLVLAVDRFGWRGLFIGLGLAAAAAAAAVFSTPEKKGALAGGSLRDQLAALGDIVRSRVFWSYAPMTASGLGGFIALQGLWAVPWLMAVVGETRESAAAYMLATTVAMVCGWLATAVLVEPLRRRGVSPGRLMASCNGAGILIMVLLWSETVGGRAAWFVLGAVFAIGNLAYAEITARFPGALAGRVNTTLNLFTFMGAFAVQSGYGLMLDAAIARGWSLAEGHRAAFGLLIALQALGFGWYLLNAGRSEALRAGEVRP